MKVLPLVPAAAPIGERALASATVDRIDEEGVVHVVVGQGPVVAARLAQPLGGPMPTLAAGSEVVVLLEPEAAPVIVSAIVARLPAAPPPAPKVLELDAEQHLVLRCGSASIELFADGTIQIHGERIDSEAEGIQRIKGAQVRIN